ncbi:MAG: hypothetical protein ACKVS9_01150, partial [Phycisphaerae bacterium]
GAAQFSNPRADLMMFFTERPTQTAVPVETGGAANVNAFQRSLAFGAKGSPVQVVYGHAAIATVRPEISGGEVTGYDLDQVRHIEQIRVNQGNQDRNLRSILPLSEWVVARRALIVEPILPANSSSNAVQASRAIPLAYFDGAGDNLASSMVQALPMDNVTVVSSGVSDNSPRAPDTIALDMASVLRIFDPNPAYDGDLLRVNDGLLAYMKRAERYVGSNSQRITYYRSGVALASPYNWRELGGNFNPAGTPPRATGTVDVRPVLDLLYPDNDVDGDGRAERDFRHFATAIPNPPAALRGNLNLQRLRACAWFQVEFLMPEDPRNAWDHPDGQARSGMPRWVSVPDGEYYMFVPDSRENRKLVEDQLPAKGPANVSKVAPNDTRLRQFGTVVPVAPNKDELASDRRVRMWPYAIRVTMRMFDGKGVLKDPITRTFEHWFD